MFTGFISRFLSDNSNYSLLNFKNVLTNGGVTPEYDTVRQ
jgi:hypothetical protein